MTMTELTAGMKTIDDIDGLIPSCALALALFYTKNYGFSRSPSDVTEYSIVNHSCGVEASLLFSDNPDLIYTSDKAREAQLSIFLNRPWTHTGLKLNDAYAECFAIPAMTALLRHIHGDNKNTLKKVEPSDKEQIAEKVWQATNIIVKRTRQIVQRTFIDKPEGHAMFLYRLRRALQILRVEWSDVVLNVKKKDYVKTLDSIISELRKYMENRFYYYLSMCAAIPENDEDALQLGYLICSLYQYDDFSNDVVNEYATKISIETLFKEERSPRMQSILRLGETNISSSPIEILKLLSTCRYVQNNFLRYSKVFSNAYDWLQKTKRNLFESSRNGPMWMAEPWRGVGKPETWLNAYIIQFLFSYRDLLREACGKEVILKYRASSARPKHVWDDLLDSEEFKVELQRDFLEPIRKAEEEGKLPKASIILFGPPGTAKTSVAQAIAWDLRWPFIEFTPHHFAEEGLEGVIGRARAVFQELQILKRCVVLFDEIDELVTKRHTEEEKEVETDIRNAHFTSYQIESKIGRLITTCFLPWFQQLRDKAEIVFIVTTNHIDYFDRAITRPGRFDLVLPIGAPNMEDREEIIRKSLSDLGFKDKINKEATTIITSKLKKFQYKKEDDPFETHWQITIGEIKFICESIAPIIRNRGEIDQTVQETIEKIIDQMWSNPLIKGKEYKKFMEDINRYRFPPIQT